MDKQYIGYHPLENLPLKKGAEVWIPAGITLRTMHPGQPPKIVNKRRRRVKIHHLLSGQSITPSMFKSSDFPDHAHFWDRWRAMLDDARSEEDPDRRIEKLQAARDFKFPVQNPSIAWAGAGGYWIDADLNDILADPANQELLYGV